MLAIIFLSLCIGFTLLWMYKYEKSFKSVYGLIILVCAVSLLYFALKKTKETFTFRFLQDGPRIRAHPEIYCGDANVLPEEYDEMGSRNVCLKKGIGMGLGMPDDQRDAALARAAARPPPAVAPPRTYCGNGNAVPAGYDAFGTRHQCLTKGVGVGMRLPDDQRQEFQNRPIRPLGKKEIMMTASRLGITTHDKTRRQTLRAISQLLAQQ
jgi:hypothetical protein